jgi:hypothetical protein
VSGFQPMRPSAKPKLIRGDKEGSRSTNQRHLYARLMEIFASYGARVDHEVTRPPMDFSCLPPFKFTAKLGKVPVELKARQVGSRSGTSNPRGSQRKRFTSIKPTAPLGPWRGYMPHEVQAPDVQKP